jgi:hypothetical protein
MGKKVKIKIFAMSSEVIVAHTCMSPTYWPPQGRPRKKKGGCDLGRRKKKKKRASRKKKRGAVTWKKNGADLILRGC